MRSTSASGWLPAPYNQPLYYIVSSAVNIAMSSFQRFVIVDDESMEGYIPLLMLFKVV